MDQGILTMMLTQPCLEGETALLGHPSRYKDMELPATAERARSCRRISALCPITHLQTAPTVHVNGSGTRRVNVARAHTMRRREIPHEPSSPAARQPILPYLPNSATRILRTAKLKAEWRHLGRALSGCDGMRCAGVPLTCGQAPHPSLCSCPAC